jgi:hypothetical protein
MPGNLSRYITGPRQGSRKVAERDIVHLYINHFRGSESSSGDSTLIESLLCDPCRGRVVLADGSLGRGPGLGLLAP